MRGLAAVLVLSIVGGAAASGRAQPQPAAAATLPDTPAGHTLRAWLDAFNSNDPKLAAAYVARYNPDWAVEALLDLRRRTGGFDLVAVDHSERLSVRFRLRERDSANMALGKLVVKDADPATVVNLRLRLVAHGVDPSALDITVDAAARTRVLDGIAAKLGEYYVYRDGAEKMVDALRAHQKAGDYDQLTSGDDLADRLTDDLRAVSHDLHLHVACAPTIPPDAPDDPDDQGPTPSAPEQAELERDNCAFVKVEHLSPNLGYVRLDGFADARVCAATATAAMGFLAYVDAIIFDLRDNHGGDPYMVAHVASYLFATRTHLNDLVDRRLQRTTQFWTKPDVPGRKLAGKPVFVLTSKHTFSAGEEFTYDLQSLKRATIVGETTGGGAHPVMMRRIDDHFAIGVPYERPINPITKTDWEGKGVVPDVSVPADQALDTARKLAGEQLRSAAPRPRPRPRPRR